MNSLRDYQIQMETIATVEGILAYIEEGGEYRGTYNTFLCGKTYLVKDNEEKHFNMVSDLGKEMLEMAIRRKNKEVEND